MFQWVRKLVNSVRGTYDAAQTTDGNRKHWAKARSSHPVGLLNPATRRTLRNRSRYEYQNNGYCKGTIDTLVSDVLGRGPRLQVQLPDRNQNRIIEDGFASWVEASSFNERLRVLETSRRRDGEGVLIFSSDLAFESVCGVSLDLRLIEADQMADPWGFNHLLRKNGDDGIKCDVAGKPKEYCILRSHPNDNRHISGITEHDWLPASQVLHWFRPDRAGQLRGVPELAPALELFAQLRRYTLATIRSAETAAMLAGVMETNSPAGEPVTEDDPFDSIPLEAGTLLTLPAGWKGSQFKPEQPTTNYPAFVDMILREIGRCLDIPFGVVSGDSSKYNYSSARLDHQTYEMRRDVDRAEFLRMVVEPIFKKWYYEFRLFIAVTRQIILPETVPHIWHFDARPSIDPLKDATTNNLNLLNGTTTLAEIYASRGLDWEEQLVQRKRELDRCKELGLQFSGMVVNVDPVGDKLRSGMDGSDTVTPTNTTAQHWPNITPVAASGKPRIFSTPVPVSIQAADANDTGPRPCHLEAYTGSPMILEGFDLPLVIDCSTADVNRQSIPLLYNHCPDIDNLVGNTHRITKGQSNILADGVVLRNVGKFENNEYLSEKIIRLNRSGGQLQASVGGDPTSLEKVAAGQTVQVNGRDYTGPCYIARGFQLREISFVVLGADGQTSTVVASAKIGDNAMTFEAWLSMLGLDPATMSEDQKSKLKGEFDKLYPASGAAKAEGNPANPDPNAPPATENKARAFDPNTDPNAVPPAAATVDPNDPNAVPSAARAAYQQSIAAFRNGLAAENTRINRVTAICAQYGLPADTLEKAIREGWSADKTELEGLRRSRPQVIAGNPHGVMSGEASLQVIEAAICQAGGMNRKQLESRFPVQTLEASHKQFKSRLGLQEAFLVMAQANGYRGRPSIRNDNLKEIITAMFRPSISAAGFSSADISNLLSNVANKFLLNGYQSVSDVWKNIARVKSVNDFKQNKSMRMVGYLEFEEVGPDGAIKHGKVADQAFTNQAKTYAKLITITRQDIINDDLGALTEIPTELGNGAATKLNKVFWGLFLDNSSFFTSGNKNLTTSSSLGVNGLTSAETKFMEQTKPDGSPLDVTPKFLLVPVALANTARSLIAPQTEIRDTTSSTKYSTGNPHAGKDYNVITSPYLSNATLTGYSATSWYLLADPAQVSTMEVCFLDGNESPIIDTADADFDSLGIQMRGYYDFGIARQDYRGGVKATA